MIAPALHVIEEILKEFIMKGEQGSGLTLARALAKAIKTRFPLYKKEKILMLSMLLDSRYKLKILNQGEANLAITILKSAIASLPQERQVQKNVGQSGSDLEVAGTSKEQEPNLWSTFDISDDENPDQSDPIVKELDFYLKKKGFLARKIPCSGGKQMLNCFQTLKGLHNCI